LTNDNSFWYKESAFHPHLPSTDLGYPKHTVIHDASFLRPQAKRRSSSSSKTQ